MPEHRSFWPDERRHAGAFGGTEMRKLMIAAAALAVLAATPAAAQQSSMKPGPLWTAARIYVEDGQMPNYMDYLTKTWVDLQDYSKAQGWLLEYHVLQSVNPRDGEPNIVLLTRFNDFPSAAETDRRNDLINKRLGLDSHGAAAASGERTKIRKQMGSVMYRELLKR
jgi:hypothetical protein